jgi:plastocyanin
MTPGNRDAGSDDPSDMEHDRFVTLASAAVDGEVTDAEQRDLDRHLGSCASCRAFVADADRLRRRLLLQPADALGEADAAPILDAVRRADRRGDARLLRRAGRSGLVAAALLLVVAIALSGRTTDQPTPAPVAGGEVTRTVRTTDRSFERNDLDLPLGATLRWANEGSSQHLLVQRASGTTVRTALPPGADEGVTFHEPGVYEVHCELHPEMAATVRVDA